MNKLLLESQEILFYNQLVLIMLQITGKIEGNIILTLE